VKNVWLRCLLRATLLLTIACSAHTPAPPQDAAASLGGTSWQMVRFQGGDDTLLTPDDPAKYTIAFGADGSFSARIDCNRGRGTWTSSGPNQLQFGPLALTRALCPPDSLHDRVVKNWEFVRSYLFKDSHLFLSLMADGGIYEFAPIGAAKAAAPNPPVASIGPVEYECAPAEAGNDRIMATFYKTTPEMVLIDRGNRTRVGFQVRAASGAKYEGQDLMFWDARGEAMVTWSGVELKCRRP
jgi:heat shock protein HslJ/membrane-bound inhibitor of C-type lysozyme